MKIRKPGRSSCGLRTLLTLGPSGDLTDGQLLERFANDRGEAAEMAFAALVERHGAAVLRTCRSILRDEHEALDAFQATFLTLVLKGRSLWVRDSLGPWLHQVACRAARSSRSAAIRRGDLERRAAETTMRREGSDSRESRGEELERAIHEEIGRLPGLFRDPIVLCDLEGQTHEQAARHLGCPVGTVKSRLSRGRERLGDRLSRRGFRPAAPAIPQRTAIPEALISSTVRIATAAGSAPARVAGLAKGVLIAMTWHKLGTIAAAGLLAALACGGPATFALQGGDAPEESPSGAGSGPTPSDTPRVASPRRADAAARLAGILADLNHASIRFYASSRPAGSPSTPKSDTSRKVRELGPSVDRLLEFARTFRGSPEAVDALAMVASMEDYADQSREANRLLSGDYFEDLLARDPAENKDLIRFWDRLGGDQPDDPAESLLRVAVEKSPHREVRGHACLRLAGILRMRAWKALDSRGWAKHLPSGWEVPVGQWHFRRSDFPPGKVSAPGLMTIPTRDRPELYRGVDPFATASEALRLCRRTEADFGDLLESEGSPRSLGALAGTLKSEIERLISTDLKTPLTAGEDLEGRPLRLADHRGKVIVIDFGGAWCDSFNVGKPVRDQQRSLVARFAGRPLMILGLNIDRDREAARRVAATEPITWRCWWDGGPEGPLSEAWGISHSPSNRVLDHRGLVRYKDVFGEELIRAVDSLLLERDRDTAANP